MKEQQMRKAYTYLKFSLPCELTRTFQPGGRLGSPSSNTLPLVLPPLPPPPPPLLLTLNQSANLNQRYGPLTIRTPNHRETLGSIRIIGYAKCTGLVTTLSCFRAQLFLQVRMKKFTDKTPPTPPPF